MTDEARAAQIRALIDDADATWRAQKVEMNMQSPPTVWKWRVFGTNALVFHLPHEVRWSARVFLSLILGSKWDRP